MIRHQASRARDSRVMHVITVPANQEFDRARLDEVLNLIRSSVGADDGPQTVIVECPLRLSPDLHLALIVEMMRLSRLKHQVAICGMPNATELFKEEKRLFQQAGVDHHAYLDLHFRNLESARRHFQDPVPEAPHRIAQRRRERESSGKPRRTAHHGI